VAVGNWGFGRLAGRSKIRNDGSNRKTGVVKVAIDGIMTFSAIGKEEAKAFQWFPTNSIKRTYLLHHEQKNVCEKTF
jgi:hypothetical protein